jgi:opacity protein-like surface antigen
MALTAAIVAAFASSAFAQAWTPPKGEGSVSMLFVDTYVQDHYFATTPGDIGHIWSKTMLLDVTYGLTDKVAISFSLPWITSKYEGTFPHPITPDFSQASPLDDGRYHSAFQDLRFDIRYNVTKKGMVLTPFIGTATPSHDYGYYGHTVVGKDLNEMQVGLSGAKMLDAILPGLFVQGRYAYTIAEKVIDISHNRSNIDLETGYFITPKLRVLALGTGQVTHGGLDFSITAPLDNYALFQYHDQISRENFLTLGGGAAYSLTENFDLFSSMIHTVTARNGHAIDRGLTIGLTWSFTTNRGKDRAIASAEGALAKCVCEKRGM